MQSGFVPGDSTINQLTYLYHSLCGALDSGKEVRLVFCDISKAFDRVWHTGLVAKLEDVGVHGPLLAWFSDYLQSPTQSVVLPGSVSDPIIFQAGVRQGFILVSILFLIYINDIL